MDEIIFLKTGSLWEIHINGCSTNILIDDTEQAIALKLSNDDLVTYFMKVFDWERWNRFKSAYERFRK